MDEVVGELEQWRAATPEQIDQIIRDFGERAKAEGRTHITAGQIKEELNNKRIALGYNPSYRKLTARVYYADEMVPRELRKQPGMQQGKLFNLNDPVVNEDALMKGAPDLGLYSKSFAEAGRHAGGESKGGISPQTPGDI